MDHMEESIEREIKEWLGSATDENTHAAIRSLQKNDPKELEEAFRGKLSFGTGGVRALMGVGPSRLNIYTIRRITQGLCDCLKRKSGPLKIVIGHDSRHQSTTFAEEVAKVAAGNGIEAFLLEELRPTPFISFLLRHLGCVCGINITASHNPKTYNGYKVYGADGAQITAPLDNEIINHVDQIHSFSQVQIAPSDSTLIHRLGDEYDNTYLKESAALALHSELDHKEGDKLKIIYSPLHGAGITLVPRLLNQWGFSSLQLVEEQMTPNGNFPAAEKPNPEEPSAMALGIEQMKKEKSDIFIATDPDADRLGAAILTPMGPKSFNGNELACILLKEILKSLKEKKRLPKNGAVIKTIVTTELFAKIAAGYGIQCLDLLTGFKYIGEKIHAWEKEPGSPQFIFGAEESYGSLYGTVARDKDALLASGLLCESALRAKLEGKTLENLLQEIYAEYGIFRQRLISLPLKTSVSSILDHLRASPPTIIGEHRIESIEDYESSLKTTGKEKSPLNLPASNVLLYRLENEGKLVIRGSGTEPKLKIYAELKGDTIQGCDAALNQLVDAFSQKLAKSS